MIEYQIFIIFQTDETGLNGRLIKAEVDKMPRPRPTSIIVTEQEITEFAEQSYAEYGNVWRMPIAIRDRIRALKPDGRQTNRSRRRRTIPRVSNTGVGR